jgi:hypothetical protein
MKVVLGNKRDVCTNGRRVLARKDEGKSHNEGEIEGRRPESRGSISMALGGMLSGGFVPCNSSGTMLAG